MASCGEERLGVNKRLATIPVKRRVCRNLLFWKVTPRGQASPLRLLFRCRSLPVNPALPVLAGAVQSAVLLAVGRALLHHAQICSGDVFKFAIAQ